MIAQSCPITPFLPSLLTFLALAGGVIFLIATWRWMRAHESVAQSLRQLADAHAPRQLPNDTPPNPKTPPTPDPWP